MATLGKPQRQHRIARLLEEQAISSQAQLVEMLASDGVVATQATVSRDLEELGAVKVRIPGGAMAYAIPEHAKEGTVSDDHLRRVIGEFVVEVAQSATVADPRVYSAFEGIALHARPAVTLRGELALTLRAKGRAQRGPVREFRPGAVNLGPIPQATTDVLVVDEQLVFAKEGGSRMLPLGLDAGAAAGAGLGPTALVLEVEMLEVR